MKIVALCGGIGGAKLALGLLRALPPGALTVIGNTGDDFAHCGLPISPDLDTICYTLSGLADPERGWGRAGESWNFMAALGELGGPDWFSLGDRDLALHVLRAEALKGGATLTGFTAELARRLGIDAAILPMSDDPVRTMIECDGGPLPFQDYFVRLRCAPAVRGVRFDGAESARPNAKALAALCDPELAGIVICPSNPVLSIAPILAVPGMVEAIRNAAAPVLAVSPLIGGRAVKGPTQDIMQSMGIGADNAGVSSYYGELIDALVIDNADLSDAAALALPTLVTDTLMHSDDDKLRLARFVLDYFKEG